MNEEKKIKLINELKELFKNMISTNDGEVYSFSEEEDLPQGEPINFPIEKVAKILPRMESKDLNTINNNQNLITNTLYKTIMLADAISEELGITSVINEGSTEDYDIIISRWMGEEIETMDKTKPIYEFSYCGLNGGWFFDRYTENGITYKYEELKEKGIETGLKDYFFSTSVTLNKSKFD